MANGDDFRPRRRGLSGWAILAGLVVITGLILLLVPSIVESITGGVADVIESLCGALSCTSLLGFVMAVMATSAGAIKAAVL